MTIEHMSLSTSDFAKSKKFYVSALKPLGYAVAFDMSKDKAIGMKEGGHTSFWLVGKGRPRPAIHIAFRAQSRKAVRDFHKAALKAGGRDNGAPGLRDKSTYGPNYYAAFVLDHDGNNIEAVCFKTS